MSVILTKYSIMRRRQDEGILLLEDGTPFLLESGETLALENPNEEEE
jgi:hypothetical protein